MTEIITYSNPFEAWFIRDIATLPRRVQTVRHIISRKRRHREMQERRDEFEKMVEREKKVVRKRNGSR